MGEKASTPRRERGSIKGREKAMAREKKKGSTKGRERERAMTKEIEKGSERGEREQLPRRENGCLNNTNLQQMRRRSLNLKSTCN